MKYLNMMGVIHVKLHIPICAGQLVTFAVGILLSIFFHAVSCQLTAIFPDGIESSPVCGLADGEGIWRAQGNITGVDSSYRLDKMLLNTGPIQQGFFIDLTKCSAIQPASSEYYYCSGSTGSGNTAVYSLNIAVIARLYQNKAVLELSPVIFAPAIKAEIGSLPFIYKKVEARVQVNKGGEQSLNKTSTPITFISGGSPNVDIKFCATNLQPGNKVTVDDRGVRLNNDDCVTQTFPTVTTPTVKFGYTQPGNYCDTGRNFTIELTALEPSTIGPSTSSNPNDDEQPNGGRHLMIEVWTTSLLAITASILLVH